jgi:Protein of unknown function (DUF3237)
MRYAPLAELAFELEVTCAPPTMIGEREGGRMMMIPITGGTINGPRLTGEVMQGGADWAEVFADKAVVNARYAIKASDGTIIQVFNSGTIKRDPGADPKAPPPIALTTPRFIAPEGQHDWLNDGVFVGTLLADPANMGTVKIGIYKMA